MFAKFQYEPSDGFYVRELKSYLDLGNEIYKDYADQSQKCLRDFVKANGVIDGTAIQNHWFSIKEANVFISHSHKDLDLVKGFAGWLYEEFGLTAFIDSCVWGYCDDLLKMIDDRYCKNGNSQTYNYKLRNYSTSHVHMMLSSALSEMIDNSECIVFMNTPNSISLETELQNAAQNVSYTTMSPWIYHELSAAAMMRTTLPKRRSFLTEYYSHGYSHASSPMRISYDVNRQLLEFLPLTDSILEEWATNHDINTHGLDELYAIFGLFS